MIPNDFPQYHQTLSKLENVTLGSTKSTNASIIGGKTEAELREVSGNLFRLNVFLLSLFGGDDGIRKAIELLRHDRFTNEAKLTDFLKESIGELPEVSAALIENYPLFSILILTLKNDPSEDHLRDLAADAYIAQYPEDERFEKTYVYLKTPNILLGHLLLYSNVWVCANPENTAFYSEQMAGMLHGTIAFDKGDRLTSEELAMVQRCEGDNPRFPIANKLEKKEGYFEVTDWCSTPAMHTTDARIDDLFIASRRIAQERVLSGYISRLKDTGTIIQKVYGLPPNESTIVAVIGPYGTGKSQFVQQKFAGEKPISVYSLDKLNELLMNPSSRHQDHHFEAMMLTSSLLKQLAEVPALLTETAAIDEFRFDRLVNRAFFSRDRIVIEEIAPENADDAINRFTIREGARGLANQSQLGVATTSIIDALRFRHGRIENARKNPKIDYTLYCKFAAAHGNAVFAEIARAKNDVVTVLEGREELFKQLAPVAKI